MIALEGFIPPIIAALGDISSEIQTSLVEALCRNFADSASIIFLGHRIDEVSLPASVIWIPESPLANLEENLRLVDCLICPYRTQDGIDERVFARELPVPIVSYWPIRGQSVRVVDTEGQFVEAVQRALRPNERERFRQSLADVVRTACEEYGIKTLNVNYQPESNTIVVEINMCDLALWQAVRLGEILADLGTREKIQIWHDAQYLVMQAWLT